MKQSRNVKIVQYGEGNFLRTFVDLYFHILNTEGGNYRVNIVKPIPFGSLEKFGKQDNKYHVVLRGVASGRDVENVYRVECLESVIDPFQDSDSYYALARDKELKIIVSNTTEAGICFNERDSIDGFEQITYPAKLTKFLLERYREGLDGVYILPVELIDNNADELKRCVDRYIALWKLPPAFKEWNDTCNFYCNTLVDRIVSGFPRDEETVEHLYDLIGERDELVSVGEPFGLWVVENKGNISDYIVAGEHNIEVILTDHIGYYKNRKVRVLNGSHTNLVAAGLILGAETVHDCMKDEKLSRFVETTLQNEIIPFVSDDIAKTAVFAESVKSRFLNPYLNHRLTSISLNSVSKWRARVLPSFKDYYRKNGKLAPNLTIGFSYLMALYASVVKSGGSYTAKLAKGEIPLQDDLPYLEHFASGKSIHDFMANEAVWGEDLTAYQGFLGTVLANVEKIQKGILLI